ncbi:Tetraspanin-8 [Channa argus]|uniref:Tetraspanin-8 n=1 Tax=Channa argus TaxID=215402 RepID=A0A6G1QRG2_CHAAH|nr:Tetraspanin-8 [Channa argus]
MKLILRQIQIHIFHDQIISTLLLALTLFSHGYLHEEEEIEKVLIGLHFLYGISIATLVLAITGVFGACKEKKWALIVYAVGMILGCLFMFVSEINGLAVQPKMIRDMKQQYLDFMPLSNASEDFLRSFNQAQAGIQCCGLEQGYVDWGYDIPQSCVCTEESTHPCVAAPRNSSLYENHTDDVPIRIFQEPCFRYFTEYVVYLLGITIGVMVGVTLLWVLSVVLCIIILCRLNRKVSSGPGPTVVYSQEAKAGNYSILTEPAELT